jgi:sialate O-acetylesterase
MRKTLFLALAAMLLSIVAAHAEVKLPHVFGSHMVLQRDRDIPVWGWAAPGEEVKVQLADKPAVATKADAAGKWSVKLPAMPASAAPVTLKVNGTNEIVLDDVLIGEVWVCSGQSNMEFRLASCDNAATEIPQANHPQLRQIAFPKRPSGYAMDDIDAAWAVCTPETAPSFTGVGYFFGKMLMNELKVPVGLINTSWGGTAIEPWTPPVGFKQVPSLDNYYKTVMTTDPKSEQYKATLGDYLTRHEAWRKTAQDALAAEKPLEPAPDYPASLKPLVGPGGPSTLYNGMIQPIIPFAIRGAIWYQGEANRGNGMGYADRTKALVGGWRELWGQGNFPFYFVQIAPYVYGNEDPGVLPVFWEAQEAAAKTLPNIGMAVINDIGNYNDIHPKNKLDVGKRLALLALRDTYGHPETVASGPTFKSLALEGSKLRVKLGNTGSGLVSRNGKPLDWFEIIDANEGGWIPADAAIDGDSVVLSAATVKQPVAMRFAWAKNAEPNLMNKEGLPAGAFRAGEVPKRDYLVISVPEAKDYQLVYSLDLSKAGPEIKYDVDNHTAITGPFSRVAYFLELSGADGKTKWAYVSMDAFTDDITKIGVPTVASKAEFQRKVTNLNVLSNVEGIVTGQGIATGNIEFWPNNYSIGNALAIPGAMADNYDFGDQISGPADGYGSMQVHNYGAKQTIFAFNNWKSGNSADLGIGNGTGKSLDWTFSGNSGTYTLRNLRVLVKMK